MSSHSRKRAQRRSDFAARKKASPTEVYVVADRGWEYITVHPMANETNLLTSLGMKPADCTSVDCYWSAKKDVVFLQVAARGASHFEPGLYASRAEAAPNRMHLLAVVECDVISRSTLEAIMTRFVGVGVQGKKARRIAKGGYRRISG